MVLHRTPAERVTDNILNVLRQALDELGSVTLTVEHLHGDMGVVDYATQTVRLADDLTSCEWRTTLAHELIHLLRGPVPSPRVEMEECRVERETARVVVPEGAALAATGRGWTDAEIQAVAAVYDVDEIVVYDAFDPRTEPMLVLPDFIPPT